LRFAIGEREGGGGFVSSKKLAGAGREMAFLERWRGIWVCLVGLIGFVWSQGRARERKKVFGGGGGTDFLQNPVDTKLTEGCRQEDEKKPGGKAVLSGTKAVLFGSGTVLWG
jgi:hypothetical protein